MSDLGALLSSLGACKEAQHWAKGRPMSRRSWQRCERADWLLWLAATLGVDRRYHVGRLEELAEALTSCDEAFVVFESGSAWREALGFKGIAAGVGAQAMLDNNNDEDEEGDEEEGDEDGEDFEDEDEG